MFLFCSDTSSNKTPLENKEREKGEGRTWLDVRLPQSEVSCKLSQRDRRRVDLGDQVDRRVVELVCFPSTDQGQNRKPGVRDRFSGWYRRMRGRGEENVPKTRSRREEETCLKARTVGFVVSPACKACYHPHPQEAAPSQSFPPFQTHRERKRKRTLRTCVRVAQTAAWTFSLIPDRRVARWATSGSAFRGGGVELSWLIADGLAR